MEQGASLRISPSWVPGAVIILDMKWDTNALAVPEPIGEWAGDLALLAGTGQIVGEWQWLKASLELLLWVPVPNSVPFHRRLVAGLDQFTVPISNGATGTGKLQPGLVPTILPPPFDWEARTM